MYTMFDDILVDYFRGYNIIERICSFAFLLYCCEDMYRFWISGEVWMDFERTSGAVYKEKAPLWLLQLLYSATLHCIIGIVKHVFHVCCEGRWVPWLRDNSGSRAGGGARMPGGWGWPRHWPCNKAHPGSSHCFPCSVLCYSVFLSLIFTLFSLSYYQTGLFLFEHVWANITEMPQRINE